MRLLRKLVVRKTYSLWTGTPVLTLPTKARAERLLGIDAHSLVLQTSYITGYFDINLSTWRSAPFIGRFVPFFVFLWVCIRADRIHSFCDRGILTPTRFMQYNRWELLTYRLIGMQVFLWTYGADVRTRQRTLALGTPNCCMECTQIGKACICDDSVQTQYMAYLHRMVTAVFAMGDMTEYSQGSINNLFFWPLDLDAQNGEKYAPAYPAPSSNRPLRIVHAPNHRMFKGTHFLEEAVAELKNQGKNIELVMVERLSNVEALNVYRTADVIFDQCLIGSHGYFGLEAMALGKPLMCYISKDEYVIAPDECPIIRVTPKTIASRLLEALDNRESLYNIGVTGRAYVEKYYSIPAFSRRLGDAFRQFS